MVIKRYNLKIRSKYSKKGLGEKSLSGGQAITSKYAGYDYERLEKSIWVNSAGGCSIQTTNL